MMDDSGSSCDDAFISNRSRRDSLLLDLEESNAQITADGRMGQFVFVRPTSQVAPMGWRERIYARCRSVYRTICCKKPVVEEACNDTGAVETQSAMSAVPEQLQFRLAARSSSALMYNFWNCISCGLWRATGHKKQFNMGINHNQQLAMYLHWMFRVNFFFIFCVMCATFFALVSVFSFVIMFAGYLDEECVRVGDNHYGHIGKDFADAFSLSWATFSTVGYGSTYPALAEENESQTNCFFISFVCSLESLTGVLYSGFCGAILFGKILRIQGHAQVIFSDPLLIRFGVGLAKNHDESSALNLEDQKIPCPVLEFRIVNRLFSEAGGEIMDATLNVVANVDADEQENDFASESMHKHTTHSDTVSSRSNRSITSEHSEASHNSVSHQFYTQGRAIRKRASVFLPKMLDFERNVRKRALSTFETFSPIPKRESSHHGKAGTHIVDEDPTARLANKRIFSKMHVEPGEHPFFKRVWMARHRMDENSPLLKPRVRRQIRRNGGHWPARLNNWNSVRESLHFNQILVSLNGVSNVSASGVYSQKIYDFVDISVGYQFVNILYKSKQGQLRVDMGLINDVREQNGGGGEPLTTERKMGTFMDKF